MMSEELEETETLNVKHRMKKVKEASFGFLRSILWDQRNKPTVETRLKLYESIIRPVMISGLCALKLTEKDRKEMVDFEKLMLRHLLNVRSRAPMASIFKLTGTLPLQAHLDNGVLSILHNIWNNRTNPIFELVLSCVNEKDGKNTWATEAERILQKYEMPSLPELFSMRCPEKSSWKCYRMMKIRKHWSENIEEELKGMKLSRFTGPKPTDLNKKLSGSLRHIYTHSDLTAAKVITDIVTDNLETGVQLKHRGKITDDKCERCGERDETEHALFCEQYTSDWGVDSALTRFEKLVLPLLNAADKKRYKDDKTYKLNVMLHTADCIDLSVNSDHSSSEDQNCTLHQEGETEEEADQTVTVTTGKKDNTNAITSEREVIKAQRHLIVQLYYRWQHGRPVSHQHYRSLWPRAKNNSRLPQTSEMGKGFQRNVIHKSPKTSGNTLTTCRGGAMPDFNNITVTQDRDISKFSRNDGYIHRNDSQQLIAGMDLENISLIGSVLNSKGRTICWRDGITAVPEREQGINSIISLISHKMTIIQSLSALNTKLTNQMETLKLLAGSPVIMMPKRLFDSIDRMKHVTIEQNTGRQDLDRRYRDRRAPTLEDLTSPWTDQSETPFFSIYSRDGNRKLKICWLHRDQYTSEFLLYDEDEELEDIIPHVAPEEAKRIQRILHLYKLSHGLTIHIEWSRRLFCLEDWVAKTSKYGIVRNYPKEESPRDYVFVARDQMTSRHENVRRASVKPLFFLPWDSQVVEDFHWDAERITQDFGRLTVQYPTIHEVDYTPRSFKDYENMSSDQDPRELPGIRSPSVLRRSTFESYYYSSSSRDSYDYGQYHEDSTPPQMSVYGNKRIELKSTDDEGYDKRRAVEKGSDFHHEKHDQNMPRRPRGANEVYPWTRNRSQFHLSGTESSGDTDELDEADRKVRLDRRNHRLKIIRDYKNPNGNTTESGDHGEYFEEEDEKKVIKKEGLTPDKEQDEVFMEDNEHAVVTLEEGQREVLIKNQHVFATSTPRQETPKRKRSESPEMKKEIAPKVEALSSSSSSSSSSSDEDSGPSSEDEQSPREKDTNYEIEKAAYERATRWSPRVIKEKTEKLKKEMEDIEDQLEEMSTKKGNRVNKHDLHVRLRQHKARYNGFTRANSDSSSSAPRPPTPRPRRHVRSPPLPPRTPRTSPSNIIWRQGNSRDNSNAPPPSKKPRNDTSDRKALDNLRISLERSKANEIARENRKQKIYLGGHTDPNVTQPLECSSSLSFCEPTTLMIVLL